MTPEFEYGEDEEDIFKAADETPSGDHAITAFEPGSPEPASRKNELPSNISPFLNGDQAEDVTLVLPAMRLTFPVLRLEVSDDAVCMILDSNQLKLSPTAGERYEIVCRDKTLRVLYVGGNVKFDDATFVSFILAPDSD